MGEGKEEGKEKRYEKEKKNMGEFPESFSDVAARCLKLEAFR